MNLKYNRHLIAVAMLGCFAEADPSAGGSSAAEAKKPKFAEKDYDPETGVCTFEFGNGKTLTMNYNDVPDEIKVRLAFHGIMQKVGDSYASAKGDYSAAIDKAQGVIDQLLAGEWRAAPGEGGGGPRLSELAGGLARVKGIPEEEALAAVKKAAEPLASKDSTDEQKKEAKEKLSAWRAHPKVKAAILAIAAEKAAAKATEAGDSEDPKLD
jgi:hypothetical protein